MSHAIASSSAARRARLTCLAALLAATPLAAPKAASDPQAATPAPSGSNHRAALRDLAAVGLAYGLYTVVQAARESAVQRPGESTVPHGEDPPPQDQAKPCKCTDLSVDIARDADKVPMLTLTAQVSAEPSIADFTLDATWIAALTCSAGKGGCEGNAQISIDTSITIDGKPTLRVPTKGEPDPGRGKGAGTRMSKQPCDGDCGGTTQTRIGQSVTFSLARDGLRRTGSGWEGNGHINQKTAVYAGTIVVTVDSIACPGSGNKIKLTVGGKGEARLVSLEVIPEMPGMLPIRQVWTADETGKLQPNKADAPRAAKK